ncbi:hypothetical protein [Acinetobacter sp. YH12218]|uniref:beta family protein n=1 Tax=Acinetobacter sp. YH12218 TaxID=2601152 RepID=UPI0015D3FA62|nr:hypothetical protein [Acinetobacter sp. YH12218]
MNSKYIPFLKFKMNEVYALNYLDDELKVNLSVFFDLPNELPSKSHNDGIDSFSPEELLEFKTDTLKKKIEAQKKYLNTKLNFLDEIFIDNYDIDPLVKIDGKTYNYQSIIDEFAPLGMIPVCGVDDRVQEHLDCVLASAKAGMFLKDKVAIRLTESAFEDYEFIEYDFEDCVAKLESTFEKIILIFDLRVVEDIERSSKQVIDFLDNLDLGKFERIIVSGSTIPKVITQLIETKKNKVVERKEVSVFKKLKEQNIQFDFGDYTCVSPETSFLDIYIETIQSYMTGKIFYPYDHYFYVTRSGKTRGLRVPFKPLLDEIVHKHFYRKKDYSFGDKYIHEKQPTGLSVTSSTILKPNINLHVTYMLRDFSI